MPATPTSCGSSIDGAAGLRASNDNLADGEPAWWAGYRDRLEAVAREATAG